VDRHTLRGSPPRLTHRPPLRLVLALAVSYHALIALTCYVLHVRALLGGGLENWLVVLCFVSIMPGMIPACVLLDRAGINLRKHPTASEKRLGRAMLKKFTGNSSLPLAVGLAFAYVVIAVFLQLVIPGADRQAPFLAVCALFHVITAVVFVYTFRWLGKSVGS
jgi:hypothetical protein